MKNTTRAFVLLGTNIRPEMHVRAGIRRLRNRTSVSGVSTVYQTKPVGHPDQSDFLNAAVELRTTEPAQSLRTLLKSIEDELGRDRSGPEDGPRKIDLDIALFGREVIQTGELTVPDPDLVRHAHVAVPLAELAPDFLHPVEERTLREIADRVPDRDSITPRPDVLLQG